MCGIAGICGTEWARHQLFAMRDRQRHRGPDANGAYLAPSGTAGLAHNRLSIIDLSDAGRQPMSSDDGNLWLVFNGEIYNYVELKQELADYPFRSNTDSEVILAAYQRWGAACLDRMVGMFAFAIWDDASRRLFVARDRFGIKPLYFHLGQNGTLLFASEIGALHAAGVPREPDAATWATYLTYGISDYSNRTFCKGIESLPPGHTLVWQAGSLEVSCWYDLADRVGPEIDTRDESRVREEYLALLEESVRLRFRADVPVGINLSGGLDSSTLLALVQRVQGDGQRRSRRSPSSPATPRTTSFPGCEQMLRRTRHPSIVCELPARDVPALAESVQAHLRPAVRRPADSRLRAPLRARPLRGGHRAARRPGNGRAMGGLRLLRRRALPASAPFVQGSRDSAVRPECLVPEFRAEAERFEMPQRFSDAAHQPAVPRCAIHQDTPRAALQRQCLDARLDRAA